MTISSSHLSSRRNGLQRWMGVLGQKHVILISHKSERGFYTPTIYTHLLKKAHLHNSCEATPTQSSPEHRDVVSRLAAVDQIALQDHDDAPGYAAHLQALNLSTHVIR